MDAQWGEKYYAAANDGIRWIIGNLRSNGSLKGASGLAAYYKAPLTLAEVGKKSEADLILNWIMEKYTRGDGAYRQEPGGSEPTRASDLYETLWIAWGANKLQRTEISTAALEYALRFFDPADGGFYSYTGTDYRLRGKDLRSTALGGLVSALLGRMDCAAAAAGFVISLLNSQPRLETGSFFLVCDSYGGVITQFPPESERYFVIKPDQQRPLYYALGLAVAFLAKLALLAGNWEYLSAARAYVDVCALYGDKLLRHDYAGKLAWGLALIYGQTGEESSESRLIEICDYLCSLQRPNGEWRIGLLPYVMGTGQSVIDVSYDRTAEYSLWMSYIVRECLEVKHQRSPRPPR